MRLPHAAALGFALLAAGCGASPPAPARMAPTDFVALLDRATNAAPDGVAAVDPAAALGALLGEPTAHHANESPASIGARVTGGAVLCAHSTIRRFDWRAAVDAAPRGAPEVALAQADAQARLLAEGGFLPIAAGSSSVSDTEPAVQWTVQGRNGGSGAKLSLRPKRLIHRRIYHAPHTSAFVVARCDYDGRTGFATVELTCVEASPEFADVRGPIVPSTEILSDLR